MELKAKIKASVIADKLLNGSISAFNNWLEIEEKVDPWKRPIEFRVNHAKQEVEIWQ